MIPITPMATSNISGGWNSFYSMVREFVPGFWTALAIIGFLIFAWGLGGYLWRKFRQRSGQGDNKKLVWSMIFAAAFVSPTFFFPLLATFADAVINGPGEAVIGKVQGWL